MQKILYITIALLFYTSSTKAQNKPFSVRINPDEKSEDGHQIEILDNKIYICASNNYKVDNVKKIGSTLYLTDMNGKEIKNIFYPALSSISDKSVNAITKDKIYYFSIKNTSDPQLGQKLIITELNHNLDSLNSFSFDPVGAQYPSSIVQYSENEFVFLVVDVNLTSSYLSLFDIQKKEIIWTRKLLDETIYKSQGPSKVVVDNDKNIVILNRAVKKGKDSGGDGRPLLSKFDGKGNKLFAKDFPEVANFEELNDLAMLDSSTYILAFKADRNTPHIGADTIDSPATIYALNKDGTIKWKKYYFATVSDGYVEMRGFTVTKNSDILCYGYKYDKKKKPQVSGWMMRLTHDGKKKWERMIRDEKGLSTAKAVLAGDLFDVKEGPYGMLYGTGLYMDTFPNYKPSINKFLELIL